jgi:hypothetical protein
VPCTFRVETHPDSRKKVKKRMNHTIRGNKAGFFIDNLLRWIEGITNISPFFVAPPKVDHL